MRTSHLTLTLGFLLLSVSATAQPTSFRIKNSCSYEDIEPSSDAYLYDPSNQADRIVAEIVDALGLTKNFVVKASGVRNAVATQEGGRRYILYSTTFLEKFNGNERTRWAAYSVLAHEIGHHLNNNDFGETDMRRRKIYELEADRFSGSVLRMLGATLEQAQASIENLEREGESATHPSKIARREAVATGWKNRDEFLRARGDASVGQTADRDGDRVPDSRDQCPGDYGTHSSGCPDSDEDSIPDKDDTCPYEKGTAANRGCPTPTAPTDRDADGVPDAGDQCPDKKGEPRYAGCPDTDGDGVPDHKDKCANEKGLASKEGCPEASTQTPENSKVSLKPSGGSKPSAKEKTAGGSESSDKKPSKGSRHLENPGPTLPPLFRDRKTGLEMVAVEGGAFTMGSPTTEKDRSVGECQHAVTVGNFQIGKYEVTQRDWQVVMGNNPSSFNKENCMDCPVEQVSWNDIQEFLKKLNAEVDGPDYRLPTEEEWEYAARGGKKSKGYLYAGDNLIGNVAWYVDNAGSKTHPVGERKANELGLFDMSGNVHEWCQSPYDSYPDCSDPLSAPSRRVVRGGSWFKVVFDTRVAYRGRLPPDALYSFQGFRLARD